LIVIAAGLGGWRIYKDRMQQRQAKLDSAVAASPAAHPVETIAVPSDPATATIGSGQTTGANESPASTNSTATGSLTTAPARQQGKDSASSSPTSGNSASSTLGGTPQDNAKPPAGGVANPSATSEKVAAPLDQPFEVTVRAVDHAWVSIKSDGKFAVRGIIGPPDVKTVRATGQVVFWTGNAGAVEVSFNGQRIPLEGGLNTQGTLVFNSHGVVIPKPSAPARVP
jgi:hypothetical protein